MTTLTQDRIVSIGGKDVVLDDCPACESRNANLISVRTSPVTRAYFVQCEDCDGYTSTHRTPEAAIAEWNGGDVE